MTFIVTLVALLIERFFDWSHLRQWRWYTAYLHFISKNLPNQPAYIILGVAIAILLGVVALINLLLADILFGFVQLWFQLFVVLYALGPQNLWADTYACINSMKKEDEHVAKNKVSSSFGSPDDTYSQSLQRYLLDNIFIEANRRVFAVIFWYALLGPLGALLYRLLNLSSVTLPDEAPVAVAQDARMVEAALDWLPARLFSFVFALGGHFVQVFSVWLRKVGQGLMSNESLLTESGLAALGYEKEDKIPADGSAERQAINLLDRVFIIILVVIAAGVLMA